MREVVQWDNKVHDRDGVHQIIYSIAFRPDGQQLLAAAGNRVLVYDTTDGDLTQSLRGHKETVYCVAYASDGKRFASGSADKHVIIWNRELDGILKYSHNDAVQCMAYNPVTQQLASCTATDCGLWSPEQKTVNKVKVPSRVLCCSWTRDGQFLALGLESGLVTVRDKKGSEVTRIERPGPVWALSFSPSATDVQGYLAVTDWSKKLSFYETSGRQIGRDVELGYAALSLSFWSTGEYIIIGGSNKAVMLYTRDGIAIAPATTCDDWVWSCTVKPNSSSIAVSCNDGTIATHQIIMNTVHGLYQDKYAYRSAMKNVVVQNLAVEHEQFTVDTGGYVKKIAIYKDRLAVQLSNCIVTYEVLSSDAKDFNGSFYRVLARVEGSMECNLLVVTSEHFILCQEKRLQLFTLEGKKEREWVLEGLIRYIKVVGGPRGQECLLVGVKSGAVVKVFIDNPFPIHLINQNASIRCLDLSVSRRYLAVVDEHGHCQVYDLVSKELMFSEPHANSVAWNSEHEEMLCFSGNGLLSIKASKFECQSQKMQGFVVGFKGSKVFCLQGSVMKTIDIPQGASLRQYVSVKDYTNAYKVACLGVTETDWRILAVAALHDLNITIARKSFIRLRDLKYLELVDVVEKAQRAPGYDPSLVMSEIFAYEGKFQAAGRMYVKAGKVEKAMDLYADLGKWELAQEIAGADDSRVQRLVRRQIRTAKETGDWKGATNLHVAIREYIEAVTCIEESLSSEPGVAEKDKLAVLIDICRTVNRAETALLEKCAKVFIEHQAFDLAIEVYLKTKDYKALIGLYVAARQWDEAFQLLSTHADYKQEVYLPYAAWLCENDRFDDAVEAYRMCGDHVKAMTVLEGLTHNAVVETRYNDAAYYFYRLAQEHAAEHVMGKGDLKARRRYADLFYNSQVYYAYHFVHRFIELPVGVHDGSDKALFHISRFLVPLLLGPDRGRRTPFGVSKVYVIVALTRKAWALGAFKLARFALQELQKLVVPPRWIDELEQLTLRMRAKVYSDDLTLAKDFATCPRCSQTNDLLVPNGECQYCRHPFVYSFYSFQNLPLVEFVLEEGLTDEEATALLQADSGDGSKSSSGGDRTWTESHDSGAAQTLTLDDPPSRSLGGGGGRGRGGDDPFDPRAFLAEGGSAYSPVKVSRAVIAKMTPAQVVYKPSSSQLIPSMWYKNLEPEKPITVCKGCGSFFSEEDTENCMLSTRKCPFCRTPFTE